MPHGIAQTDRRGRQDMSDDSERHAQKMAKKKAAPKKKAVAKKKAAPKKKAAVKKKKK